MAGRRKKVFAGYIRVSRKGERDDERFRSDEKPRAELATFEELNAAIEIVLLEVRSAPHR